MPPRGQRAILKLRTELLLRLSSSVLYKKYIDNKKR
jgi:hypothetical protein